MIVSSRRLNLGLRTAAAVTGDDFFGDAAGEDAVATGTVDAVAIGDEYGVEPDADDTETVGAENAVPTGDGSTAGGALWYSAHFSQPSQTVADSGISRPHDAHRFTRVSSCSRARGVSRTPQAAYQANDTMKRAPGSSYPWRNWHQPDKSVMGQTGVRPQLALHDDQVS